eukprot:6360853-Pyramimonas_sp.AAC.1
MTAAPCHAAIVPQNRVYDDNPGNCRELLRRMCGAMKRKPHFEQIPPSIGETLADFEDERGKARTTF